MPFAAPWTDLEIITRGEASQTERQTPCDIPYVWDLKHDRNERIHRQKQTHKQKTSLRLPEGKEGEGAINQQSGISRHAANPGQCCTQEINREGPPPAQGAVLTVYYKVHRRRVCITESLCCTPETNTYYTLIIPPKFLCSYPSLGPRDREGYWTRPPSPVATGMSPQKHERGPQDRAG